MTFDRRKLWKLRTGQGLTQRQLAETVGVWGSQVSEWERGVIVPSTDHVAELAGALGVPIDDLHGEEEA